jgi:NADPH:quinone reductase
MENMMRAYQVVEHGDPSSLQLNDVADILPGKGQILVKVHAAGINYPDVLVVSGKYQVLPPRPFTPGKDLAGVVSRIGPGVTGFAVGERVLGQVEHGAFAEQAVLRPDQAFKIPDAMSFAQAAAMGLVYQTAYLALVDRGAYKTGETVLVGGAAGGIGLAALHVSKGLGARVIAAVRGPDEARFVKDNGADVAIDISHADIKDSLRAQVHAATNGAGVDIVLDPLGGDFFAAALRAMAWCGRLVVIGFAAGDIPALKVNYLLLKNISVLGIQWSDYRDRTPERVSAIQADIFRLWQAGAVKPYLMREYPFDELPQALDLIRQGHVRGKLVVIVDPDQR